MLICFLVTSSVGFGTRIYSGLASRCNKDLNCLVEVLEVIVSLRYLCTDEKACVEISGSGHYSCYCVRRR